jgi:neutral ceramidase
MFLFLFLLGNMVKPYDWEPSTLPIQMLRVGNLFIVVPAAEFTTMAGRRLRESLYTQIRESKAIPDDMEIYIVIAGLSNSYSHYVTTYEEYQAQRYEAASTLYGPHTLQGYKQEFSRITADMLAGRPSASAEAPKDLSDVQIVLGMPKVPFDHTPQGFKFGDVHVDVEPSYKVNFIKIYNLDILFIGKRWQVVATDGDWETTFHWEAGPKDPLNAGISGISKATVSWEIPSSTSSGTYRLCYFGNDKKITGKIGQFSGCSSNFEVLA